MTDKQIKEFFKNGFYCIEPCPEIKELLAKLKAKEQECEELKEQFKLAEPLYQACNIKDEKINQLKADNKHLNDLLNQALKELEEMRELKDTESLQACILTRENERLKELLAQDQCFQDRSHKCVKSFYIDERYKQAIEKVREIANRPYLLPCGGDCKQQNCTDKTTENGKHCMELKLIQILQICDEVNQ